MEYASPVEQKLNSEEEFDALLFKVIDEQLIGLFGETGARSIYESLVNQCRLKKEDIPKKIDVFAKALEDFFGSGAYVIQKLVLTKMHCLLLRFVSAL